MTWANNGWWDEKRVFSNKDIKTSPMRDLREEPMGMQTFQKIHKTYGYIGGNYRNNNYGSNRRIQRWSHGHKWQWLRACPSPGEWGSKNVGIEAKNIKRNKGGVMGEGWHSLFSQPVWLCFSLNRGKRSSHLTWTNSPRTANTYKKTGRTARTYRQCEL